MAGIYIHIPFCKSKCKYCDFASFSGKEDIMDSYVSYLCDEIANYQGLDFDTVYIGGGTPTTLSQKNLEKIFDAIYKNFNICDNSEITIEANPATVTYDLALFLRKKGVNRISMGGQTFVNNELLLIGRCHNADDIEITYNILRKAGFDNINIDLMYALPEQTMDSLDISISKILSLNPEHISCYGLKIEEGTPFYKMLSNGKISEKDDEEFSSMYYHIVKKLTEAGYEHYEISNFSKPGYISKHNCKYWECEEYLGVGLGASSYLYGKRWDNPRTFDEYFSGNIKIDEYIIGKDEQMSEFIILGLRMLKSGVDLVKFKNKFAVDIMDVYGSAIEKNLNLKLVEITEDKLRLKPDAYCISNVVMSDFI